MALEVYVPSDGLQGQTIPGHVLWGPDPVESITITASPEFSGLEAFNVDPGAASNRGNTWVFRGFQRPGYLGFILKTARSESLDVNAELDVLVSVGGKEVHESRTVRLFRPSLGLPSTPKTLSIDEGGHATERIVMRHQGHGTLFVTVNTVEDSAIKSVIPEELLHAVKGFADDFTEGLEQLRPKYPNHPALFEPPSMEELQDRDALARRLSRVVDEIGANDELATDVQELFSQALLQNADFESLFFAPLLDFFSSIVSGGTILSMPWLEFEIPEGESRLSLIVEAKDVLGAEVFKTNLPEIIIRSKRRTTLPLTELIHWDGSEKAGGQQAVSRSKRAAPRPSWRRRRRE
jgi:hypothetical protein